VQVRATTGSKLTGKWECKSRCDDQTGSKGKGDEGKENLRPSPAHQPRVGADGCNQVNICWFTPSITCSVREIDGSASGRPIWFVADVDLGMSLDRLIQYWRWRAEDVKKETKTGREKRQTKQSLRREEEWTHTASGVVITSTARKEGGMRLRERVSERGQSDKKREDDGEEECNCAHGEIVSGLGSWCEIVYSC
jgi:hypothetical protein